MKDWHKPRFALFAYAEQVGIDPRQRRNFQSGGPTT
jgi:hypothetical protein